jgi:hypothetical protein
MTIFLSYLLEIYYPGDLINQIIRYLGLFGLGITWSHITWDIGTLEKNIT